MRAWRGRRLRRRSDDGAAAVEFALITPLLFALIFGILEYGYGMFEIQAAQSTATTIARDAARGVAACTGSSTNPGLREMTQTALTGNGFTPGSVKVLMKITPTVANRMVPAPDDLLTVTLVFTPRLQLFFVPYPDSIARSSSFPVESLSSTTGPMSCGGTSGMTVPIP